MPGDRLRVGDGRLVALAGADPPDLVHPLHRVLDADGDVEAHDRDPVAALGVAAGAQADRHRQPEAIDVPVELLVVATQPAGHATDEGVVQRATGGVAGPLEIGGGALEDLRSATTVVAGSSPARACW